MQKHFFPFLTQKKDKTATNGPLGKKIHDRKCQNSFSKQPTLCDEYGLTRPAELESI